MVYTCKKDYGTFIIYYTPPQFGESIISEGIIPKAQFGFFDKITGQIYDTNDSAFDKYYQKVFGWIKQYQTVNRIKLSAFLDDETLSTIDEHILTCVYLKLDKIKNYISTLPDIYKSIFRIIKPGGDQLLELEDGNEDGLFFLNSNIFRLDRKPEELVHDSKFVNDMATHVRKIHTIASNVRHGFIAYKAENICDGYFWFVPDLKKAYPSFFR